MSERHVFVYKVMYTELCVFRIYFFVMVNVKAFIRFFVNPVDTMCAIEYISHYGLAINDIFFN